MLFFGRENLKENFNHCGGVSDPALQKGKS
jgi:hypothetical protein